jgi:hypothetical protein
MRKHYDFSKGKTTIATTILYRRQIRRLNEELAEKTRLLRRLNKAFKGWSWDEDELPYYPMVALKNMFEKKK